MQKKKKHSNIIGIYWFTQEIVEEIKLVMVVTFLGIWWFYVHFIQYFQSFPKKHIKHISKTIWKIVCLWRSFWKTTTTWIDELSKVDSHPVSVGSIQSTEVPKRTKKAQEWLIHFSAQAETLFCFRTSLMLLVLGLFRLTLGPTAPVSLHSGHRTQTEW